MYREVFGSSVPTALWRRHSWLELRKLRSFEQTQILRIGADIGICAVTLSLAYLLRFAWAVSYEVVDATPDMLMELYVVSFIKTSSVLSALLVTAFLLSGIYDRNRADHLRRKTVVIAEAVTLVYVFVGMLAFLAPDWFKLPRSVLLTAGFLSVLVFVASRLFSSLWRYVLKTEQQTQGRTGSEGDHTKTILVIGGGGYIGSALLPKLLQDGYRVRVLDLLLYGTSPISGILDNPALEIIRADFRDADALVKGMRGVSSVIHLGGIVGDPACSVDEELTIDVNLAATRLIAEVAKGCGVKRFVFASTCSVYGASDQLLDEQSELNPLSLYARSKMASERVLERLSDETFAPIIARFGTIYGLSGRTRLDLVVNLLTAKAILDKQITVYGGEQWRPFVHVEDAANAIRLLLRMPLGTTAEIFNVGVNRDNRTIAEIGQIIKRRVPEAELIYRAIEHDRRDYRVDFSKIERMIGFKARWSVEDGVRQVADAIYTGSVTDYENSQYSNYKFMSEIGDKGLAPPRIKWAHELISAPVFTANTSKAQ